MCGSTIGRFVRSGRQAAARERPSAVAVLPLALRSAAAGLVATAARVGGGVVADDLRRCRTLGQQLAHRAHRAIDVVEEGEISLAEVVQPGLAGGGLRKAVLGAAAVAGEA